MPELADLPVVAVVGSLVWDLVFWVDERPAAGQTVFGRDFQAGPGGKGFNQAIAARRLGADVVFVGRVGRDDFGADFRSFLLSEGVPDGFLFVDDVVGTGVASPVVDAAGQNSIVVVPRANRGLGARDVELARPALERATILLLQYEVPNAAAIAAARIVGAAGGQVILNPAPAMPPDEALLASIDLLVPNEHEIGACAGRTGAPEEVAQALHARLGVPIVLTLGDRGARLYDGGECIAVPPFSVACVDSTGAGDAFCAGLAVALAEGRGLFQAVRFASAAGAVAVTRGGTGATMPRRAEVERLLRVT